MVGALYVDEVGIYSELADFIYGIERDARTYVGPYPVVAHPPCQRWGNWAGERIGQDGGCFAAALAVVRQWGGVIEHPAGSKAWIWHHLRPPSARGGWRSAGDNIGLTCQIEQGHYGHRARKATWLYYVGPQPPELKWGPSVAKIGPRPGRDPKREQRIGAVQRMGKAERERTPRAFAELLLSLAGPAKAPVEVGR
jgi:hypothetical protein